MDRLFRVPGLGGVDAAGQVWRDLVDDVGKPDPRLEARAQVAPLMALDGSEASLALEVERAVGTGPTAGESMRMLLAPAPTVVTAKLVGVAPALAAGPGIAMDMRLESPAPGVDRRGRDHQRPSPSSPTARAAPTASPRDVASSFR